MEGWQPSADDGDAAVVVDADVGVFVAAVGVGHRGQHQAHQVTVQARKVGVQVDRLPAGQRGDDPQNPLLATGQRAHVVVGDRLVVEPPPTGWSHGWIHG
jgi:hypothetical protein